MATISIAEAEGRFRELLERVSRGEQIVLTKDDEPIAEIKPVPRRDLARVRQAVDNLRALRRDMRARGMEPLTDEEILSAIHEGHKY